MFLAEDIFKYLETETFRGNTAPTHYYAIENAKDNVLPSLANRQNVEIEDLNHTEMVRSGRAKVMAYNYQEFSTKMP